MSKRLGSAYRMGRTDQWLKIKNPDAPAVRREREIDWVKRRRRRCRRAEAVDLEYRRFFLFHC